jgi:hypothetical protein
MRCRTATGTTWLRLFDARIHIRRSGPSGRPIGAGDRLLVEVGDHSEPVTWLLTPLSVGASVVLCANLDRTTLDDRIAAEGVTHVHGGPIDR